MASWDYGQYRQGYATDKQYQYVARLLQDKGLTRRNAGVALITFPSLNNKTWKGSPNHRSMLTGGFMMNEADEIITDLKENKVKIYYQTID